MPPSSELKMDQSSNFKLISTINGDGDIPLSKYKSNRTGITVIIAETPGPIVNGYLCLATEAHDDDGLPHTLEHLIFLGSENYPFKGILDILANRSLASGTNAWTATDHTCYTMTTAGSEGFLNLLPIYLDHVLYPTLSDSGFKTEVHHINGEGENAGVVYCEMQGRENTGESLAYLSMLRAIYPGHCGYKSETGGIMLNLRESTTHEKVKNYHEAFYRPDNLCIVVVGQVKAEDVFNSLQSMEDKILSKGNLSNFQRPWQTPVPPFQQSVDQTIEYPCDDENHGLVIVSWRGPKEEEFKEYLALTILMDYLTDTSVATLKMEFVEIEDPFCSSVSYSSETFLETAFELFFKNVPTEKLDHIKSKLVEVLNKIASDPNSLDMERMTTMIHRRKLHILYQMEGDSDYAIADRAIRHFLYGNNEEHLNNITNQITTLNNLSTEKSSFWLNLLKQFIADKPMVLIIAKPSADLSEKMATEEKDRIAFQREKLGPDGLKNQLEEVEKAIQNNEIEPPISLLRCISIPGIESIKFHSINRCCSYKVDQTCDLQSLMDKVPCRFQLDDINSKFVALSVFMNVSHLSEDLRLYLPLWTQLITESSILRNGSLIPYEQIVAELASDTVFSHSGIGIGGGHFSCGSQPQLATLQISVEKEKYVKGVTWLRELLFDTRFTTERVSVVATKLLYSLASMKREGNKVATVLLNELVYQKESSHYVTCIFRQQTFLEEIRKKLETNPDDVIKALEDLRSNLTEPSNITIHMATDVKSLTQIVKDVVNPWTQGFMKESCDIRTTPPNVIQSYQLLKKQAGTGTIAGVGAVESSYLRQCVQLDLNYDHPDLPALLVLIEYLTQLEGPMWKEIRGHGLAYHYNVVYSPKQHLLYLVLFKSTHLVNAYKEAKSILEKHLNNSENVFEETLLESGRSSLIFELVNCENTLANVSGESQLAYFGDYDMEYKKTLLAAVLNVTIEDMRRVGPLHLSQLFDNSKAVCGICCNPSKVDEIVAGFKGLSKELIVIQSLEKSSIAEY